MIKNVENEKRKKIFEINENDRVKGEVINCENNRRKNKLKQ